MAKLQTNQDKRPRREAVETVATSMTTEIIFLDLNADNPQAQIDAITSANVVDSPLPTPRIVGLNTAEDGVECMTRTLRELNGLDVAHVICSGCNGQVRLGNVLLCEANIASYASRIAGWQMAFSRDAEIHIHGCDLASAAGVCLIEDLSLLTSARIIA